MTNRSAALEYPRRRRRERPRLFAWSPSTGACSPGRSAQRASSTSIAARSCVTWAATPRIPSWYCSSTARVIAPAHRDDDTAVTVCLRRARHRACDVRSMRPKRIRSTSSPRYTEPNSSPIAVSAVASPEVGSIRVRIRTPAGPTATTGSPIRCSTRPSVMPRILAATTDNLADGAPIPLTSAQYQSLPLTIRPAAAATPLPALLRGLNRPIPEDDPEAGPMVGSISLVSAVKR